MNNRKLFLVVILFVLVFPGYFSISHAAEHRFQPEVKLGAYHTNNFRFAVSDTESLARRFIHPSLLYEQRNPTSQWTLLLGTLFYQYNESDYNSEEPHAKLRFINKFPSLSVDIEAESRRSTLRDLSDSDFIQPEVAGRDKPGDKLDSRLATRFDKEISESVLAQISIQGLKTSFENSDYADYSYISMQPGVFSEISKRLTLYMQTKFDYFESEYEALLPVPDVVIDRIIFSDLQPGVAHTRSTTLGVYTGLQYDLSERIQIGLAAGQGDTKTNQALITEEYTRYSQSLQQNVTLGGTIELNSNERSKMGKFNINFKTSERSIIQLIAEQSLQPGSDGSMNKLISASIMARSRVSQYHNLALQLIHTKRDDFDGNVTNLLNQNRTYQSVNVNYTAQLTKNIKWGLYCDYSIYDYANLSENIEVYSSRLSIEYSPQSVSW